MQTAILIISHGSRNPQTKIEVDQLAEKIGKKLDGLTVLPAYLELEQPSIENGSRQLIDRGADRIVVLQNFLNSGRHVNEDIPEIFNNLKKEHPDIEFDITPPVGLHEKIPDLFGAILKTHL